MVGLSKLTLKPCFPIQPCCSVLYLESSLKRIAKSN